MNRLNVGRWWLAGAIAGIVGAVPASAGAQDPFGPAPQVAQPAAAAAQPVGPAGDAGPGVGAEGQPIEATDDPVVRAIEESAPKTPAQLLRAAQTLLDLGHPERARNYIKQLLADRPPIAALADLQRRFGSALLMRMSRDPRIAPEGGMLADAVLQAAWQAARDPQRVDAWIAQLGDPDPATRRAAQVELRSAGSFAAARLVSLLTEAEPVEKHAAVRQALIDLNEAAIGPLIGVLAGGDEPRRIQAMDVLGRMGAGRATVNLVGAYVNPASSAAVRQAAGEALRRILGQQPTRFDARQYLHRRASSLLTGRLPVPVDVDGTVEIWTWDPAQQTVVPRRALERDAALVEASRVAADLWRMEPDNAELRRIYLAANLAAAKVIYGLDRDLPVDRDPILQTVAGAGPQTLSDVLRWSIEEDTTEAAIGAAQLLGHLRDDAALISEHGQPAALARALEHPDRRVRFAALGAILEIDPAPFAGSSRVPETLAFFVRCGANRRALVASPDTEHAGALAGMLAEFGLDADVVSTGANLYRRATGSGDYELILISEHLNRPSIGETLQLIRFDHRTARVPVCIIRGVDRGDLVPVSVDSDARTIIFPPPQDVVTMGRLVQRLLGEDATGGVDASLRLAQSRAALGWLERLAQSPADRSRHDLHRAESAVIQALSAPPLTRDAARVLGLLATPSAQQALVDLASQNARPLADRQAAASAFDAAVKRRGILLTTDQIVRQYDRYNASADLDQPTQQVLGAILDVLERPRRDKAERDAGTATGHAQEAPGNGELP